METQTTRNTNINIRARSEQKALIDRASNVLGKSRSDFMLDAAYKEAMDVILDERIIHMTPEDHDQFVALLNEKPRKNAKLKALLNTKPPWSEN